MHKITKTSLQLQRAQPDEVEQKYIFEDLEEDFIRATDHWHFETSQFEKKRYETLIAFALSVPHKSILEIGCAEGHFTKLLSEISSDITAIDVSPTAIKRAKERLPNIHFEVTSLDKFTSKRDFDLVVCAEVLYYITDKKKSLQMMAQLSKYLLTSHSILWKTGCDTESSLSIFNPIMRTLQASFSEKKLTLIGLWKMR